MNLRVQLFLLIVTACLIQQATAIEPYRPLKNTWEYYMPPEDFYFLDLDKDKVNELYVVQYDRKFYKKSYINVFNLTGGYLWSTGIPSERTRACGEVVVTERMHTMFVDDLDADTNLDIVVSTKVRGSRTTLNPIYVYEREYDWVSRTHRVDDKWSDMDFDGIVTAIRSIDFENDGIKELLVSSSKGIINVYDVNGKKKSEYDLLEAANDIYAADVDKDKEKELVVGAFKHVFYIDGKKIQWKYPIDEGVIKVYTGNRINAKQMIYATDGGTIYALRVGGKLAWKKKVDGEVNSIITLDTDNDGNSEILAATGSSIKAFNINGRYLWEFPLENKIELMAVVSKNSISVGTTEKIYILEPDDRYSKNITAYAYYEEARGYYLETPRNCLALNKSIEKAITIFREIGNTDGELECDVIIEQCQIDHLTKELGDEYYQMALNHFKNKNYEEARIYNQKAMDIYLEIGYTYGITWLCSKLASDIDSEEKSQKLGLAEDYYAKAYYQYSMNNLEDASTQLRKAKELYLSINDSEGITKTSDLEREISLKQRENKADKLLKTGEEDFEKKNFDEAITSLDQALEIYLELNKTKKAQTTSSLVNKTDRYIKAGQYRSLALESREAGDYEGAIDNAKRACELYEQLKNTDELAECENLVTETENAKKELEMMGIAKMVMIVAAGLILVAGIIAFIKKKTGKKEDHGQYNDS